MLFRGSSRITDIAKANLLLENESPFESDF